MTCLRYLVVLTCCLSAFDAAASAESGEVAGHVRDHTGAPLPGVMVTLAERGLHRSAVTTESGEYRVTALPPGRYVVTFALPGFAPHTRPGVGVAAGGVARIDVVLQVALHTEVTVTGR